MKVFKFTFLFVVICFDLSLPALVCLAPHFSQVYSASFSIFARSLLLNHSIRIADVILEFGVIGFLAICHHHINSSMSLVLWCKYIVVVPRLVAFNPYTNTKYN